jgi:PAS domain S-box-containing protein
MVEKFNLKILDVLNALPFYVLLIDEDHQILEANIAVSTQLGVKREDILGGYCPQVIHRMDSPFPGCPLEESVEKNHDIERELFDAVSSRWVVSAVYPVGAVTRGNKRIYLHMVTDITERKLAQEQLKIAHEQLKNTLTHLESVREEEKREMARNLHDETSQQLASLYAHLEAAISTIDKNIEQTKKLLRKAQTMATTALDEIHNLIYDLRPSVIDELGLIPAISHLADRHLKTTGIRVILKTAGRVHRLPGALEIALFRVVQECFNNIARHAKAHNVTVFLQFKPDRIKLRIGDDGIGFNVKEIMNSRDKFRGLGLLGIRERADMLSGTLEINSRPGYGTEVTIDVPANMEPGNG